MQQHSTVRSWAAIAVGVGLFFATLVIMFWRFVVQGNFDGFNQFHVYALAALAVAFFTGHFAVASAGWSIGGIFRPIGFSLLFVMSTLVCISLTGASTSETFAMSERSVEFANTKRTVHEAHILEAKAHADGAKIKLTAAETRYGDLSAKADKACEDRRGCTTARRSQAEAKADMDAKGKAHEAVDLRYWKLVNDLEGLKAPQVANQNFRQIAKAVAWRPGDSRQEREARETLYLEALLLYSGHVLQFVTEFGSILFFNYGFSGGEQRERQPSRLVALWRRLRWKPTVETQLETAAATVDGPAVPPPAGRQPRKLTRRQSSTGKPSSTVVNGPWRKTPMAETKALAYVRDRLAHGRAFPSQDDIAARCGVTKSAVSKWVAKWEAAGFISKSRDGRCNVIAAAK